jgi:hypothetical protein
MSQALNELAAAKVSVWLDDLSRSRIDTGSLVGMVDKGEIDGSRGRTASSSIAVWYP